MALNLYLDPAWRPEDGGELVHRDVDGEVTRVAPRFNSVSLIPVSAATQHWVEPYRRMTPGRYTVALGFGGELGKERADVAA